MKTRQEALKTEDLNSYYVKQLKRYEPCGASKRVIDTRPNYTNSTKDIRALRLNNRNESELKRRNLDFTSKLLDTQCMSSTREKDLQSTHRKVLSVELYTQLKGLQNTERMKKAAGMSRIKRIDQIMENCDDLNKKNKSELRKIPKIVNENKNTYRAVSEIFEAFEYLSIGSNIEDCLEFKKQIDKIENSVLGMTKNEASGSLPRIKNQFSTDHMKKVGIWRLKAHSNIVR